MLAIREGEVWEDKHTGNRARVENVPDGFGVTDPGNQSIELRRVDTGEWFTVFRDNFERHWTRVQKAPSGGGPGGFRALEYDL